MFENRQNMIAPDIRIGNSSGFGEHGPNRPESPECEVEIMKHEIQYQATGSRGIKKPVLTVFFRRVGLPGKSHNGGPAQITLHHHISRIFIFREEADNMSGKEPDVILFTDSNHAAGFIQRTGERLLTHNRTFSPCGKVNKRSMEIGWNANIHNINVTDKIFKLGEIGYP